MFDPIALPEWLADGVLFSSFCVHGGLFLFLYNQHKSVRDGCTQVSLFHHAIAFVVGLYCSYLYIDDIVNRPTLKPNDLFPWTQWLTRFNAGYFFYDSIHVCIWDQVFIPHHFVVLVGLIGTDVGNVTALTNSVNTWMTEIGSLLYNMYVYHKSETTYLIFLVSYAASRFVLAGWSCYVFYDIWSHIFAGSTFLFFQVLFLLLCSSIGLLNAHTVVSRSWTMVTVIFQESTFLTHLPWGVRKRQLHYAVHGNLRWVPILVFGVHSAEFLQGRNFTNNDAAVSVWPPAEACVPATYVRLLVIGVYGLRAAPRMWYDRISQTRQL